MPRSGKKLKYNEGDWFAVPLTNKQFALGLVARVDRNMHEILGYFFGEVFVAVPVLEQEPTYSPADAVLMGWVGERGIVYGTWPLVLRGHSIDKQKWPVPVFAQRDMVHPEMGTWLRYDNDQPSSMAPVEGQYVPWSEIAHLPKDGLYGHIALELRLSLILL